MKLKCDRFFPCSTPKALVAKIASNGRYGALVIPTLLLVITVYGSKINLVMLSS